MQKLQLYISSVSTSPTQSQFERIDLFKDEQVSISLSIQNIKTPDKIFTEFTKTFTIPASKTNNQLFEHYYNFNIIDGFDARNKRQAKIELNDIAYKTGFIALNGVELTNNKPNAYKITFYGETINLNKQFRDSSLNSLQGALSTYNLDYKNSDVVSKMSANVGDVIITPLVTHTTEAYYDSSQSANDGNLYPAGTNGLLWSELKYAINLPTIIDAIQTTYGLIFSTNFFGLSTNQAFNNLYMWLNAKKGNVEPISEVNTFTNVVTGLVPFPVGATNTKTTMTGTSQLNIISGNVPSGFQLDIFTQGGASVPDYTVRVTNVATNSVIFTSANQTTSKSFTQLDFTLGVGFFVVDIIGTAAINFQAIKWSLLDVQTIPSWSEEWQTTSGFSFQTIFEFIIGQQMPDIKVIDFLNGLFKMFNLTAYFDNQPLLANSTSVNPNFNKIVIQTLDEFFSINFNIWDISEYVDTSKTTVNVGLPYNKITFSYEGEQTFYAEQFLQVTGGSWGAINYDGIGTTAQGSSFNAPNTPYNVTTPFEHLQMVRLYDQNGGSSPLNTMTGFFTNDNKESMVGLSFLFYPVKLTTSAPDAATPIRIKKVADGSSFDDLTSYIIPSNSLALNSSTSKENINFNNENNEWTDDSTFTGTLFENYYKQYIQGAFNLKRRIVKISAILPLNIIYKIQMNDRIVINNVSYQINELNINLITGESKFELLNRV